MTTPGTAIGEVRLDYTPEPKQAIAHRTIVDEMLYGGAAGGGKSRAGRVEVIRMALLVPGSRSVIFRRTFPDLQRAVVEQMRQEMPPRVARYNEGKHLWRFRNGSVIELAYLQRDADVYNYQGAEYQLIVFEEVTQFSEKQYKYLLGRLRASGQVRDRLDEIGWMPRIIATGNPGGVGHLWVKRRWVDPVPPGVVWVVPPDEHGEALNVPATVARAAAARADIPPENIPADIPGPDDDPEREMTRVYIPAKASDNSHIDRAYQRRLDRLDPMLRRALRDGDWDVLEGVRFSQWTNGLHVITPEQMPPDFHPLNYPCCVGVDYGMENPFSAVWLALLPDRRVLVYRQIRATGLTPREQAQAIKDSEMEGERTPGHPMPVVLDPACWARSANHVTKSHDPDLPPPGSIAHTYRQVLGGAVVKARNERVGGWALIDEHLRIRDDGRPGVEVVDTCRSLIATLPALPRDDKNPEDVDTHADDHDADAFRYGLQHLAGRPPKIPKTRPWEQPVLRTATADFRTMEF